MNILVAGQKWFGAEVFRALRALPGVSISAVCAPAGGDKLARALPPGLHPWLVAEAEHDPAFYEPLLEPA